MVTKANDCQIKKGKICGRCKNYQMGFCNKLNCRTGIIYTCSKWYPCYLRVVS